MKRSFDLINLICCGFALDDGDDDDRLPCQHQSGEERGARRRMVHLEAIDLTEHQEDDKGADTAHHVEQSVQENAALLVVTTVSGLLF